MDEMKKEKRSNQEFKKQHYERLVVEVPKGERAKIAAYAQARGKSVQGLVRELLYREMEQSGGRTTAG